jgi:hypothetical protein
MSSSITDRRAAMLVLIRRVSEKAGWPGQARPDDEEMTIHLNTRADLESHPVLVRTRVFDRY